MSPPRTSSARLMAFFRVTALINAVKDCACGSSPYIANIFQRIFKQTVAGLKATTIFLFIVSFVFIICRSTDIYSQPEQLMFRHFTEKDGMPRSMSRVIFQDHIGYIWIGTDSYLIRYDGYRFKFFYEDPDDPFSFRGKKVVTISEDRKGNLWIGTHDGLFFYNRTNDHFTQYEHIESDSGTIRNNYVFFVYPDTRGHIWTVSGDSFLDRLDPVTGKFQRFCSNMHNPGSMGFDTVYYRKNDLQLLRRRSVSFLEDHAGNFWIGSARGKGLDKYDPKTGLFTHYLKNSSDSKSLKSNDIFSIFSDSRNRLWIGTLDGLYQYIYDKDSFATVYLPPAKYASTFTKKATYQIYEDCQGMLWLCQPNRLVRYNPQTGHHDIIAQWPSKKYTILISPLGEKNKNGMWFVAIPQRLYSFYFFYYDYRLKKITIKNPNSISSITQYHPTEYFVDRTGLLWVGTISNGLYKETPYSSKFTRYQYDKRDETTISHNIVTCFCEDHSGTIWIGTPNGLNRYIPEKKAFHRYNIHPGNKPRTGTNQINALTVDKNNNLWIGTPAGVDILDLRHSGSFDVNLAKGKTAYASSLETKEGDLIPDFAIDGNQNSRWASKYNDNEWFKIDLGTSTKIEKVVIYWELAAAKSYELQGSEDGINWKTYYSTDHGDGGIDVLSVNFTGRFLRLLFKKRISPFGYSIFEIELYGNQGMWKHIDLIPPNKKSIDDEIITALNADKEGNIWIATPGNIYKYNSITDSYKCYAYDETSDQPAVRKFIINANNKLWLVQKAGANGILTFHTKNETFKRYVHSDDDSTSLSMGQVVDVQSDKTGNIILNVYYREGDNMWTDIYIPETDAFRHVKNDGRIERKFIDAGKGNLWVATWLQGLQLYNLKEDKIIKNYSISNGLQDEKIRDNWMDQSGFIWLITYSGLSRFDPTTEHFENFGKGSGLVSDLLDAFTSKNGEVFLRSDDGLYVFDPLQIQKDTTKPTIVIQSLKISNKKIHHDEANTLLIKDISHADRITLPYNQNLISLEFVALHYALSEKNQYAYKLEGLDEEWQYIGNKRYLNLAALSPGSYNIKIKGSNGDGVWNEKPLQLRINIKHPPWATWWAYTGYAVIAFGLFFMIYRYESRRLKHKHQTQHLLELDRLKTNFFSNISHEFRTPLTLMLSPLKSLYEGTFAGDTKKIYGIMLNNGRRLLQLVNQLLDLSKIDAGKLKLHIEETELIHFVRQIVSNYDAMAKSKKIHLTFYYDIKELTTYIDKEKMATVINNILSNAFKFSPENAYIIVHISTEEDRFATITIRDRGPGIAKDETERIFDRFYQSEKTTLKGRKGTGLGMAIAKELMVLHHGKITVHSQSGEGSTFKLYILLGKEHFRQGPLENHTIPPDETDREVNRSMGIENLYLDEETEEGIVNPTEDEIKKDNPSILVIEDNRDMISFLKYALQAEYHIEACDNGDAGIENAFQNMPDLILCDVMLPGTSGYDICHKLKNDIKTSHIPIILMTALADREYILKGLKKGADDYVIKPFDLSELKLRIYNLLESRKLLREKYAREIFLQPEKKLISSIDEKFLQSVMQVIEQHLGDFDYTSKNLSDDTGFSRVHFYRKIKALTGLTPSHFLVSIRLKRAAELLKSRADSISQIAYRVGFNNVSYFNKKFKEQYQKSPSDYMKSAGSDMLKNT